MAIDNTVNEELIKASKRLLPYLNWTISEESPGYHPTLPSAVAAFKEAIEKAQSTK